MVLTILSFIDCSELREWESTPVQEVHQRENIGLHDKFVIFANW